jgi:hypothetical protein
MQDSLNKSSKKEPIFNWSVGLVSGYYLSFLAIGLLYIIVKADVNGDLKQGLFFILMSLVFGSLNLLKSAANKDEITRQRGVDAFSDETSYLLDRIDAIEERNRANKLAAKLRLLGIDPDE